MDQFSFSGPSSSGAVPSTIPARSEPRLSGGLTAAATSTSLASGGGGSMTAAGGELPPVAGRLEDKLAEIELAFLYKTERLRAQFEDQQRQLAVQHQASMHEYLRVMVMKQQQQQQQRQVEEMQEREHLEMLKHKKKEDECAVASSEVKLRLRDWLVSRSSSHLRIGPTRKSWSSSQQAAALEQQSPPIAGVSPPLHPQLALASDDDYPLRKTSSEPNLKMKSKFALKKMMQQQRSSPLSHRRDAYARRRIHHSSESGQMSNPDSGPNTPPSGSQGSSGQGSAAKEEQAAYANIAGRSWMHNHSMPNIGSNQPRPMPGGSSGGSGGLNTDMRARLSMLHGQPGHSHPPPLVMPHPAAGLGYGEMSPVSPSHVEAQMRALELSHHFGRAAPYPPPAHFMHPAGFSASLDEAAAVEAENYRGMLFRTLSAPLPVLGQGLWHPQALPHHLHQDNMAKELLIKHLLKQKVQANLMQAAMGKNHMEDLDEENETRAGQDMRDGKDDYSVSSSSSSSRRVSTNNKDMATNGPLSPPGTSHATMPVLTRMDNNYDGVVSDSAKKQKATGLAFDPLMLKHQCLCGDDSQHPESPARIETIYTRFQETGLLSQCERLKVRKATLEELQSCHSEVYTLLYASNTQKLDPRVFETLLPRFCKLPCGGIGVDADTFWNDVSTPQAVRAAAGCVIELAYKVVVGELGNGFALVRPPGHHAEPVQAMGFCYFNSIAIATKQLLNRQQIKRILIVDWDVHHGNSTQQIFYADPRVLYISLHRHDGGFFFPGTGGLTECGIERGTGYNVNIAWDGSLNPPMGDAEYLAAFRSIVMPIAAAFDPEIVLVSAGFDATSGHAPALGGYCVSAACFSHMTRQLQSLAGGRLVLVLEGGYELTSMSDAAEACLRTLLGYKVLPLGRDEYERRPHSVAVGVMNTAIKIQEPYWPHVSRYARLAPLSAAEADHLLRQDSDTASAFASLSVMTDKNQRYSVTSDRHGRTEESMDT